MQNKLKISLSKYKLYNKLSPIKMFIIKLKKMYFFLYVEIISIRIIIRPFQCQAKTYLGL